VSPSPVGWVHLVGEGPADLQGGPYFFSNTEMQENKREQGGQHFRRGGGGPRRPPRRNGAARDLVQLSCTYIYLQSSRLMNSLF